MVVGIIVVVLVVVVIEGCCVIGGRSTSPSAAPAAAATAFAAVVARVLVALVARVVLVSGHLRHWSTSSSSSSSSQEHHLKELLESRRFCKDKLHVCNWLAFDAHTLRRPGIAALSVLRHQGTPSASKAAFKGICLKNDTFTFFKHNLQPQNAVSDLSGRNRRLRSHRTAEGARTNV